VASFAPLFDRSDDHANSANGFVRATPTLATLAIDRHHGRWLRSRAGQTPAPGQVGFVRAVLSPIRGFVRALSTA
jgi:hypothetical protein